jgi:hypothetical protein
MQDNPVMHESMQNHPSKPAPQKWVYHPTKGKQCVPMKMAKKLLTEGWYDTPAKFPQNVKKAEKKAAAKAQTEAESTETESSDPVIEEVTPDPEASANASEDDDAEQEEESGEMTLPNEFVSWTKAQMEEFVVTNGIGDGLDLRRNKEDLVNEVIAMVQDYNAKLA